MTASTPRSARSWMPRTVLLASCVVATAITIARPTLVAPTGQVALVVGATVGAVAYALLESRDTRLGLAPLVTAVAVLLAVSVAAPPRGSHDIWSYVMYGRIASVHHANPYVTLPAAFPHDPFVARVASGWRRTPSVYGVTFVAYAATATRLAGNSALGARLAFQALAGGAVVAALVLLWRRYRRVAVLAMLGLQPVVWISVVNNGHNDAVVGLAILGGALLLTARRVRLAAVVLALAASIKLTAVLAIAGGAIWLWRRHGTRATTRFSTIAAAVLAAAYAPVVATNIHALSGADRHVSRGSSWNPSLHWFVSATGGRHLLAGLTRPQALSVLTAAALVVVAVAAVVLAVKRSASPDASASVASATAAYLFGGAYVLPWYSLWVLPAAAARERSWTTWVIAIQAGVLTAIYQLPQTPTGGALDGDLRILLSRAAPLLLLIAFAVAFVAESTAATRAGPDRTPLPTAPAGAHQAAA